MQPETKYAKSGDVHVAYQVLGDGPIDLVIVPGWVSHVEVVWEEPQAAAFLRRLGEFSRLIIFDKRGTGMSDPITYAPQIDERMDDIRAVMDAAGSDRAALLGYSEGGALAMLFAASHPDRVSALIAYASFARLLRAPDYPWRQLLDQHDSMTRRQVERFRGRELKHTGDGVLATFDGPARAVQCARAIQDATRAIGLEVRAGVHAGECEVRGDDIGGLAVHIAARVAGAAGPGQVLVSSTVKDLVAGSTLDFIDRATHDLKGVPGEWRLYEVTAT